MQYREFGKTGFKISALGFGTMRLPMPPKDSLDYSEAVNLLTEGFKLGINYVDTAYFYCDHRCEYAVGEALKQDNWREKIKLSTKLPLDYMKNGDDFWRILEEQLGKLQTSYIDFYHLHGIGLDDFNGRVKEYGILENVERALDRGMIKHLSFSFHDKPENMKPLIDSGVFSSVLCQYNLLDRANEEMLGYAHEKGLGTAVMGPVGGGRLGYAGSVFDTALGGKITTPELAMRFVLSNPAVSCALSGMGNMQMLHDNVRIAASCEPLDAGEIAAVEKVLQECGELKNLYCTGCGYCKDECPQKVNIPDVLDCLIQYKVYRFEENAKVKYRLIGSSDWLPGATALACNKCGKCEKKCPQKLPIRKHLSEAAQIFDNSKE